MKLSDIPTNPDKRMLRQFAVLWIVFFSTIAALQWIRGSSVMPGVLVALAFGIGIPGAIYPLFIKPIFVTWMILVFPIGWIISHTILLMMFFLIFTPLGLVLRLFGHDPLRLRRPDTESYWANRSPQNEPRRYLKQF